MVKDQGWDVELTVDDAVFLNSVYKGRYPTEEGLLPHGEPLREDAERAISAAGKLVNNLSDVETKGLI